MNYDAAQTDELYTSCIKRIIPHISKLQVAQSHDVPFLSLNLSLHSHFLIHVLPDSFDPHQLVLLAFILAVADHFPEELIRKIFNVDFLGKLDSQLESMHFRGFTRFFFKEQSSSLAHLR